MTSSMMAVKSGSNCPITGAAIARSTRGSGDPGPPPASSRLGKFKSATGMRDETIASYECGRAASAKHLRELGVGT